MIYNKIPNIFLTGFMGAGKSTIGIKVAQELDFEFVDIDELIESTTGKSVSLGGGTLIDSGNAAHVKDNGVLIYLSAEPEELWKRVKNTNKRPLLRNPNGGIIPENNAVKHIEELLKIREKGYKLANTVVPTDKKSIDDVLTSVLQYLSS